MEFAIEKRHVSIKSLPSEPKNIGSLPVKQTKRDDVHA